MHQNQLEVLKHRKKKHIWKPKDNSWEEDWPPFCREWTVNINATEPVDIFVPVFREDVMLKYCTMPIFMHSRREKMKLVVANVEAEDISGNTCGHVMHPLPEVQNVLVLRAMALIGFSRQCQQILRYLHFADNITQQPGDDELVKVRPVLDSLQRSFYSTLDPEEFQSVDEMIISFKGKQIPRCCMRKKN